MLYDFYATREATPMRVTMQEMGDDGWHVLNCGAVSEDGGVTFWACFYKLQAEPAGTAPGPDKLADGAVLAAPPPGPAGEGVATGTGPPQPGE